MTKYFLLFSLFFSLTAPAADELRVVETETVRRPPVPHGAINLNYVFPHYPKFKWNGEDSLADEGISLELTVEWLPIGDIFGKPGIGGGFAPRHIGNIGSTPPMALTVFPLTLFLSYHFDFVRNQWFVPYVKGGRSVSFFDVDFSQSGGRDRYDSWDYAVGLQVCLDNIDPRAARNLLSTVGVTNTYFSVEYFRSTPAPESRNRQPDLSREEIHLGMRFEI